MMRRQILTPILLLIVIFTMTACIGDDGGSGSNLDGTTVDDVLADAREAWNTTESAHFELKIDGDAFLDSDETIRLESASGNIKRPGSVTAKASVDIGISVIDISLVAVDGQIYITNLLTGDWERAPEDFSYDPSVLFSDTDGIGPIMSDLANAKLDGTETLNGQPAYKISGTVSADRVAKITAGTIAGDAIQVTFWTSVDNAKLLRVVLTEPDGVRDSPAKWTLDLSEHDKDIEIDAPTIPTRTP